MSRHAASQEQQQVKFVKIDSSKQLEDTFRIGEKLGEGAFGSVLLAQRLQDGEKFAVKKVAKQKDTRSTYGKSWENEILVLRRFRHENLVRLHVIYESENNCYLFMEFCDCGTLSDELQRRGRFEESDARCYLRQVGGALSFLHRKSIVHRDLKLQNCLLKSNPRARQQKQHSHKARAADRGGGCQFTVKLTDFGLSIELREADQALVDNVGTPAYQAPEMVSGNSYSFKCDTWSFGILFYWMLHGDSPYRCRSEAELSESIRSFSIQRQCASCTVCNGLSAECTRALHHLLVPAPVDRWTASEFMASAWVTETESQEAGGNILEMMRTLNKANHADS